MNRSSKIMLWIGICLLAGASGAKMENYFQRHRNDIVIKHLETVERTVTYQDISVTADLTFFWVDTHSERDDFNDERVCIGSKLHLALMAAVKYCESKDIEIGPENLLLFYTHIVKYFYKTDGPFNEGRDWVSLNIKSITYPTKEKQHITIDTRYGSGVIINPYYKDNCYFKEIYFKKGVE